MNLIKLLATLLALGGSSLALAGPVHDYQLNGSLADALGGPSLVASGGSLGATGYSFGTNQGLSLSNALADGANYSIEMRLRFDNNSTTNNAIWLKIIDFKNLSSDDGLYSFVSGGAKTLDYCVCGTQYHGATDLFSGAAFVDVLLTRDKNSKLVTGYANGVQQFSFIDAGNSAVFSGPNQIMNFVRDDYATLGEASSGMVDSIRIYDNVITPVAEPESGAMLLLGIGMLGLIRRRPARR